MGNNNKKSLNEQQIEELQELYNEWVEETADDIYEEILASEEEFEKLEEKYSDWRFKKAA